MHLLESAQRRLEGSVLDGDKIDWQDWLKPSDVAAIVPAEKLAQEAIKRITSGSLRQEGLPLPWNKSHGQVLIRPGKVVLWCGWSHHGKSQMVKQVMLYAIRQGHKVLIASMEEEILDVWTDMARMYCHTDNATRTVLEEFTAFVAGHLWLYDQQGSVEATRMQAVLRYASAKLGVNQAVIDSLMMLGVNRDDYEAQSRFLSELKAIGKDDQTTIHLVAHMRKREGKTGDESPGNMHDISGGHEIASKADYVFNVWRDRKAQSGQNSCVLSVEKQRGQINWLGRIGLNFHERSRQYVEGYEPIDFSIEPF